MAIGDFFSRDDVRRNFKKAARRLCCAVVASSLALSFAANVAFARPVTEPEKENITYYSNNVFAARHSDQSTVKSNFLIMVGPGEKAFDYDYVKDIIIPAWNTGSDIYVVGDTVTGVDKDDLTFMLEKIKASDKKTTFCLLAHGRSEKFENGENYAIHMMIDGNGKVEKTKIQDLFKLIRENYEKQTDLFVLSCHGGASVKFINELPDGSRITAMSGSGKYDTTYCNFYSENVRNLKQRILDDKDEQDPMSGEHALMTYIKYIDPTEVFLKREKTTILEAIQGEAPFSEVARLTFNVPSTTVKGYKTITMDVAEDYLKQHKDWSKQEINTAAKKLQGILTEKEIVTALDSYKKGKATNAQKRNAIVVAMAMVPQEKATEEDYARPITFRPGDDEVRKGASLKL